MKRKIGEEIYGAYKEDELITCYSGDGKKIVFLDRVILY